MPKPGPILYREASESDVAAMAESRSGDVAAGPADERMADYFAGKHHPRYALEPRKGFVATDGDSIVGYVAGHLTKRFGCEGELQYLYVAPAYRRQGIARALIGRLGKWFVRNGARRVCVNVDAKSPGARELYSSLSATDLRPYWMEWRDIGTL